MGVRGREEGTYYSLLIFFKTAVGQTLFLVKIFFILSPDFEFGLSFDSGRPQLRPLRHRLSPLWFITPDFSGWIEGGEGVVCFWL